MESSAPLRPPRASVGYVAQLAVVGLAACGVSCLFFCPRFVLWRGLWMDSPLLNKTPEVGRAVYALQQLKHPLTKISDPSSAVLQWRLLLPFVGHALHLSPGLYLALPHIGCIVVTAYAAHLMLRQGASWLAAFFAATLLATGSWFFVSTGWLGYADSWYLLGLLAVAFSPWRTTIAVTCLLEPFIDERFVLTLPLVYVVRQIYFERFDRRHLRAALIDAAVMAAPSVPYIALRLLLLRSSDAWSNHYVHARVQELRSIHVPWYRWVDGWWQGLRCGWLLVVAAIWLQLRRRLAMSAVALAGICLATIAMALLIASDIGRSSSALWPSGLLGILLLLRWRPRWLRYALPVLLLANLLLPANYIIMGASWPVRSSYTELAEYRRPTGMMSSAAWIEAANAAMSQQRWADALQALDIAVRLDDRSSEALATRAILEFNFNHLYSATVDADAALAIDPKSANALFIRGAIYMSRHDPSNAARLLREALALTPLDWPHRQQCRVMLGE